MSQYAGAVEFIRKQVAEYEDEQREIRGPGTLDEPLELDLDVALDVGGLLAALPGNLEALHGRAVARRAIKALFALWPSIVAYARQVPGQSV